MTFTSAAPPYRSVSGPSRLRDIQQARQDEAMERPTWNEPVTGCPWWDEARLVELLIDRGLSFTDAGAELGCHPETVRKWADRYGIEREVRDAV